MCLVNLVMRTVRMQGLWQKGYSFRRQTWQHVETGWESPRYTTRLADQLNEIQNKDHQDFSFILVYRRRVTYLFQKSSTFQFFLTRLFLQRSSRLYLFILFLWQILDRSVGQHCLWHWNFPMEAILYPVSLLLLNHEIQI